MGGTKALLVAAGVAFVIAPVAAPAQSPPPNQRSCFVITQFEGWRAPDPHTMYIRVGINRFFRIGMASACPALTWPGVHLVTTWRTSGIVCTAMDWDLKVSTDVHGMASPCIVSSMAELTPEEAAQIPPRYKP